MRKLLFVLVPVTVLSLFGVWGKDRFLGPATPQAGYRLAKVEKRDLVNSVSATGTLSAVITVEVGSQISGRILELLADFNSQVRKGDVIARLDPESYQALVREAEAELSLAQAKRLTQAATVERCVADLKNARAKLASAQAQTDKAKATFDNARRELERNLPLLKKGIISKTLHDTAETAVAQAKAQLEQVRAEQEAALSQILSSQAGLSIARAQIKEAEAQIDLKKATLDKRRVDLDNTIIRSPVDGTVIDRSVDVGQTVAASLQAPTLFTIAQDLSRMQVSTSVDEADIGRIREGQPAVFTVDAFGTRRFSGRVTQIRKAGKTLQNVVTYPVIISADNPDLSLMPGMTANVDIQLVNKTGVLAVTGAALRFKPAGVQTGAGRGGTTETQAVPQPGPQSGRGDPEERLRQLTQALDLTQAQQDSLRTVFQEGRKKIKAVRQGGESGPGAMDAFGDRIRKETQTAVLKVLTSEQRQRYAQLVNQRGDTPAPKGTLWRLDGQNRPVAVPVTLGISDGTYTEISGAGIEPGMEVIVGTL